MVENKDPFYEVARAAYRIRPELSVEAAREQIFGLFQSWPRRPGRHRDIERTLLLGGLMQSGASDVEIAQATGWTRQYVNKARRELINPLRHARCYAEHLDDAAVYAVEGEEAKAILRERRPDLRGKTDFVVATSPTSALYRETLSPALRRRIQWTDAGREPTSKDLQVWNGGVTEFRKVCVFIRQHHGHPKMPEYVRWILQGSPAASSRDLVRLPVGAGVDEEAADRKLRRRNGSPGRSGL